MDPQKLEEDLNNMTAKEVREYAKKHYPDIYHFSNSSKKNNIDAMVLYEENSEVLDAVGRAARRV